MKNVTKNMLKEKLSSTMSAVLILQLLLGAVTPAFQWSTAYAGPQGNIGDSSSASAQPDPKTAEDMAAIIQTLDEYESASDATPPSLPTSDTFHLTRQSLIVGEDTGNSREISLSEYNLEPPSVAFSDFDHDVSIEIDRGAHALDIVSKKTVKRDGETVEVVKGRHRIAGFDVVAFARDQELVQFVDADGKMYAFDMAHAKSAAFKMPLPVFEVGSLDKSEMTGDLRANFLTRGLKPFEMPEGFDAKQPMNAGDFVLTRQNADGSSSLVRIYDRSVTLTQLFTGQAVISILANIVTPEDGKTLPQSLLLATNEKVREGLQSEGQLNPIIRQALNSYKPESIEKLLARSSTNGALAANNVKDKFLYDEWLSSFQKLDTLARAELNSFERKAKDPQFKKDLFNEREAGDYNQTWQKLLENSRKEKTFFENLMTRKAMSRIAVLTAGAASIAGLVADYHGYGPVWAVHLTNNLYQHYWPEVLKDTAYRMTMFKSGLVLSSFVPALWLIHSTKGNFKKAFSTAGMRIYAFLQLPFWSRMAGWARQSNLMPSLRAGVNPFKTIKADSADGRAAGLKSDARPGLNSLAASRQQIDQNTQILEAVAMRKKRVQALSWILANAALSEERGIDPMTLLAAESLDAKYLERLTDDEMLKIFQSDEFQSKWSRLAEELTFAFMNEPKADAEISDLSKADILELYKVAKNTIAQIEKRTKTEAYLKGFNIRLKKFTSDTLPKFAGNYGFGSYYFLKEADPSKFVYETVWRQFVVDYSLAVVQVPLFGPRADFSKPADLAADPNALGWTTKAHLADMGQQVAIYGSTVPARYSLVYQLIAEPEAKQYSPEEYISLQGATREQGFWGGISDWLKGASNLSEADYGGIMAKTMIRRLQALQAGFIMDFTTRIVLAGQGVVDALGGFAYTLALGDWSFGWMWQPVNQGMNVAEGRFEGRVSAFTEAKRKISQGLRLNDPNLTQEGYVELNKIADEAKLGLPKDLRNAVETAEKLLNIPADDLISASEELNQYMGPVVELKVAIDSGEGVQEKYDNLKALYRGEDIPFEKLDPQAFLDYAVANPPIYTKADGWARYIPTLIGALATTYAGTKLFAESYHHMSWGEKVTHAAGFSVVMYVGLFYAQKGINRVAKSIRAVKQIRGLPLDEQKVEVEKSDRLTGVLYRGTKAVSDSIKDTKLGLPESSEGPRKTGSIKAPAAADPTPVLFSCESTFL